jgi:hypothetical protein
MSSKPSAAILLLLCAVWTHGPAYGEEDEKPRSVGTTEKVEVRLVTVDVLVLDRKDAAVAGLEKEDFDLRVDGDRIAVDTVDESCAGELEDPRAVRPGGWAQGRDLDGGTRRIILVLDYLHRGLPAVAGPGRVRCRVAVR